MKTSIALLFLLSAVPGFGKTYFNCANHDLGVFIQYFPEDQSKLSVTVAGARIYPLDEGFSNVKVDSTALGELVTVSHKKIISDPQSRAHAFLLPKIELKPRTSYSAKSVLLMGTVNLNKPAQLTTVSEIACSAAYYE